MKKIKLLIGALVLTTTLFSCSSDDDPAPVTPTPPATVSTGNYWPMAVNNQWNYELNDVPSTPVSIVSTNAVDSNQWFTLAPAGSGVSATQRIRKADGNYYMRVEQIVVPASGPVPQSTTSGNTTIVLKDYLNVGESWTDTYTQTTTFEGGTIPTATLNFSITCTIMERNSSITVNGTTYNNVIKLKRVQTYSGPGIPEATATAYYWYVKDVGPVKIINGSDVQELTSFELH